MSQQNEPTDASAIEAAGSPSIEQKEAWSKPEIKAYRPTNTAEGISYNPLDGISNLTPS